jgi:hypothetical protein
MGGNPSFLASIASTPTGNHHILLLSIDLKGSIIVRSSHWLTSVETFSHYLVVVTKKNAKCEVVTYLDITIIWLFYWSKEESGASPTLGGERLNLRCPNFMAAAILA